MGSGYVPILDLFNLPAPGANVNIPTTDFRPTSPGVIRITFVPGTTTILDLVETRGGTAFAHILNSGSTIAARAAWTGVFHVSPLSTYNFRIETNGVVNRLHVDLVVEGVL